MNDVRVMTSPCAPSAPRWTRRRLAGGPVGGALLLACGQAARQQDATTQGAAKRPVTLTYLSPHVAGAVGMERDEQQFKLFNQLYPHITVELAPQSDWNAVKEKFIVLASGGTPAHLVQNGFGLWMDMARSGTIRELSSFFKTDKVNPEALFIPLALDQYSNRGVMYGFPVSVSSDSFAYKKDLFDRDGIPYPPTDTSDKNWTLERFLDVAQKLTRPGQQVGMLNTHDYWYNRGTWYGQVSWDDTKRQAFVNRPSHIKGQQFWMDLRHRYQVVPTSDEAKQLAGGASNAFVAGKAAMMYTCCPLGLKDLPFGWGLATLPYSGPAGSKNISGRIWPHALHVAKTISPAEAEAAWALFKWYMSKPEYGGLMPPSNSHQVAPYKDAHYSDLAQKEFEEATHGVIARAPLLTAQSTPPSGCGMLKYEEFADVQRNVDEVWKKVEANQLSAADFANQAQKAIEDAKLGSKSIG